MRNAPSRSPLLPSLIALAALMLPHASAHAKARPATAPAPAPANSGAPLADLVARVDIPAQGFTLPNGLRVIVHTDRKAPIVGVTTYYRVGSKNEPRGHTGFAHLYEHLFFGGSENVPNFDEPLEAAGSTASNGSTWYDRTNYVETVPTGALDMALFLESDRMGHLAGALTQEKLDKQRGVVENEKRQNDNQPGGLVDYAIGEGLFPVGHPYRHATIGSMADLDAATLGYVRRWYAEHYAPGNAILVLSGDIDVVTARPLVEKYYGDIPTGPAVVPVVTGPVTLAAPASREMRDAVATTRITRAWSGPGLTASDEPALDVGMRVLGGLASSRLDNDLVRGQQLAVSVSASVEQQESISILSVAMEVKPGVDRKLAEAALDAEIARYLREGPSADELRRAAMQEVSGNVAAMEKVGDFGGKGSTLAEGLLFAGDAGFYKAELARIAALTPAQVRDAMRHWLGRPVFSLTLSPGERTEKGEGMGGWGDEAQIPAGGHPAPAVDARQPTPPVPSGPPRLLPAVAPIASLSLPIIEHARLSNGMAVTLAHHGMVPRVLVALGFDAGIAADAGIGEAGAPGQQGLMLAALGEGTDAAGGTLSATALREAEERLGATIASAEGLDESTVTLDTLSPNLAPSLALLAAVVRHPAFAPDDVARLKAQRLAALAEVLSAPAALAARTLDPLLFGRQHPYGQPGDGLGTQAAIAAATPALLRATHDRWLRPDLAHITVVGDVTMAQALPLLERAFGDWHAPATPAPVKAITAAPPSATPRIVVIDRPHSPQSVIRAGRVLALRGALAPGEVPQDAAALANQVLGNDFLSRLNTDLREDKGWSYGVHSQLREPVGQRSLIITAPVQADRTGDAIRAILADMAAYPATRPTTATERERATEGNIRALPNGFETNAQLLGKIETNDRLHRPDDYYATLPARLRALDGAALDTAAKAWLQPDGLTFVVVGDAKAVVPQLQGLGMPVEVVKAGG